MDLYKLPNISEYEEVHLMNLWENRAVMEERLESVKDRMSDHDRHILEAYIDIRNELEYETIKTALRWGKRHYK